MTIIDGKATAGAIKEEIRHEVDAIVASGGKRPHLSAILVGHDGGSEAYMKNKMLACEKCGITSSLVRLDADATEEEVLREVERLNNDPDIDGYIVQLPLPKHIDEHKVIMAIDYLKDVDGFHPINVGRMAIGLPCFISATPLGIITLLQRYNIETSGKKCVILGRSNIVGRPMAELMMQKRYGNATVTVCHSQSPTLEKECREADIIIAAVGRPGFVTADMVKPGAVVIDVGTTRIEDPDAPSGYRLAGDVDFESVKDKCSFITPVPGGVGPMTVCSLMRNTLTAARRAQSAEAPSKPPRGEALAACTSPLGGNEGGLPEAEKLYLQGNEHRRKGNYGEALNCYIEAIRLDPDSPAVHAKEMLDSIMAYYCKDYYNP